MQTPITLITGFLGAGKTTLIGNLIASSGAKRFAVLINEFADASVDEQTLNALEFAEKVQFVNIQDSLLGYGNDDLFEKVLLKLATGSQAFDYLIIETSGLAAPTAALQKLLKPELSKYFKLDSTLCIVDTPKMLAGMYERSLKNTSESQSPVAQMPSCGEDGAPDHCDSGAAICDVFSAQLKAADVVVLNKIDAVNHSDLQKAEGLIREASPSVRFIELAYHAKLDNRLALDLYLNEPVGQSANLPALSKGQVQTGQASVDGHSHSGLGPHDHGILTHEHLHEHDPGWVSFALHCHDPQKTETLKAALVEICKDKLVLRVKGEVFDRECDARISVQAVSDRLSLEKQNNMVFAGQHQTGHGGHAGDSRLVFIGYNISRSEVSHRMFESTGTHWH